MPGEVEGVPERLKELILDPQGAIDALPAEVREEYERRQQSVVDARRAAPGNEGRLWIS